jgi:hypothetical protein
VPVADIAHRDRSITEGVGVSASERAAETNTPSDVKRRHKREQRARRRRVPRPPLWKERFVTWEWYDGGWNNKHQVGAMVYVDVYMCKCMCCVCVCVRVYTYLYARTSAQCKLTSCVTLCSHQSLEITLLMAKLLGRTFVLSAKGPDFQRHKGHLADLTQYYNVGSAVLQCRFNH